MSPAIRALRWVFDLFAGYAGVVVVDAADYREAARESQRLAVYVAASGHLPNSRHARRQVRFSARRIAARMRQAVLTEERDAREELFALD